MLLDDERGVAIPHKLEVTKRRFGYRYRVVVDRKDVGPMVQIDDPPCG